MGTPGIPNMLVYCLQMYLRSVLIIQIYMFGGMREVYGCKLMYGHIYIYIIIIIIIYIISIYIYLNHFEIFCVNGYCIYQNSTTGLVPVLKDGNWKSMAPNQWRLDAIELILQMLTPGKWVKKTGYPLVNIQKLWKITIFNGKTHYKWWFSIAMLNYQRV